MTTAGRTTAATAGGHRYDATLHVGDTSQQLTFLGEPPRRKTYHGTSAGNAVSVLYDTVTGKVSVADQALHAVVLLAAFKPDAPGHFQGVTSAHHSRFEEDGPFGLPSANVLVDGQVRRLGRASP